MRLFTPQAGVNRHREFQDKRYEELNERFGENIAGIVKEAAIIQQLIESNYPKLDAPTVSSLILSISSDIQTILIQMAELTDMVDQEIEATVLDAEMARLVKADAGAPDLKFTRRYYVTGRRLVELSVSVHPADRFSYRMTIRRDAVHG